MEIAHRLLICIPCKDRKAIVERCVPTVREGMWLDDHLICFDDGSTEYDAEWLMRRFGCVALQSKSIGIEAQRKRHFEIFGNQYGEVQWTHLYLTDSDAIHTPDWREVALRLQQNHGGAPVCLYNTLAHSQLAGNTIEDNPANDVIWRRYAPGISYLLTREHVAKVMKNIDRLTNWDWQVCDWLGNRMAISRTSYVEHIGQGGLHHPSGAGLNGGDVALHPTSWLQQKRREVVAELEALK